MSVATPLPKRDPFRSMRDADSRRLAEAKRANATMLARTDDEGRPLYRMTSGGNVVRTRKITKRLKAKILDRDGHACVQCGATKSLEAAHVEDYRINGNNHPDNLRTLCTPCHRADTAEKARA